MISSAQRYQLNRMNNNALNNKLGTEVDNSLNLVKLQYDFSVSGGAVGSINLLDADGSAFTIPNKAIIKRVLIDVITAPTSGGGATIALTANSAGDLKAALAIASWTGRIDGLPLDSAASVIKLTADRIPLMTIATAALTAGKFNVYIEYVLGD